SYVMSILTTHSAPDEYKKLAVEMLILISVQGDFLIILTSLLKSSDMWNAVYHNDVKPLSRLEMESKYSSTLPTRNLPKPRNSHGLDSAAGMKTTIGYK